MTRFLQCAGVLAILVVSDGWTSAAEQDSLQQAANDGDGVWRVVAQFRDGQPVPEGEYQDAKLTLEAGTFVVRRGDEVLHEGTFTLVSLDAGLRKFELKITKGPFAGERRKQISRLETNTLTVCMGPVGGDWPREFSSSPGNRCSVTVYKRSRL